MLQVKDTSSLLPLEIGGCSPDVKAGAGKKSSTRKQDQETQVWRTEVQKYGSQLAGPMSQNVKCLTEAEGSLLIRRLETGSIKSLQATVKYGEGSLNI